MDYLHQKLIYWPRTINHTHYWITFLYIRTQSHQYLLGRQFFDSATNARHSRRFARTHWLNTPRCQIGKWKKKKKVGKCVGWIHWSDAQLCVLLIECSCGNWLNALNRNRSSRLNKIFKFSPAHVGGTTKHCEHWDHALYVCKYILDRARSSAEKKAVPLMPLAARPRYSYM